MATWHMGARYRARAHDGHARVVSGYLKDAGPAGLGTVGAGATHAWAEVYVPGAGWITFDPTNRSVGGANLIPVAVVRDITQAVPVAGLLITTEAMIADKPEPKGQAGGGMPGGMGGMEGMM